MKAFVEKRDRDEGKPCMEMDRMEPGVLTNVPDDNGVDKPGHPVIRVGNETWYFPATASTEHTHSIDGFCYRPLQPGERIVIEGD